MKRLLLFVFVSFLLASSLKGDWLNFRGPQGSGRDVEAKDLPAALSEETLAWKAPLPGRGLGSPVLVGERVYLTAASGPDQKQLHILCFNTSDGSPVWERKFWATGRTMAHKKTSVAAPTPASDGKRIFALYSSNDLICVDLDGNLLWMRGLTLDYPNASNSLGMASSPIVVGDTLIAQVENDSESFAAGFDVQTGTNKWKMDRPKAANWTSPTVVKAGDEKVVALQSSKGIVGVIPNTGSKLFEFGKGASTIPSGAAVGDRLYIPSGGLTALNISGDGADPETLWNESAQRPGTASPIIFDEQVFVINNAGVLSCANRENGERLWRVRLEPPFSGSPVAGSKPLLYIFNEGGLGQVVDISGEEGKTISSYDLGETILSTPSLDSDALYIRSDKHLWKFATP